MLFYFYDMSSIRLALVQSDIAWEDPEENFRLLSKSMASIAGADLVILPEMWPTGFSMTPERVAEKTGGPALRWMQEKAVKYNFTITGSVSVEEEGKYYNRMYIVFADGTYTYYDKRHLFSYAREDLHYQPGDQRMTVDIKGWKVMPIICYDLRFPVWCRNDPGYDLMIVVANWPDTRILHWDSLLTARAIENQSYVAAVNRIGKDGNGLNYPGHSSVIDMNGNILLEMNDQNGIGEVELDKKDLTEYRQRFRFLQDRDEFDIH